MAVRRVSNQAELASSRWLQEASNVDVWNVVRALFVDFMQLRDRLTVVCGADRVRKVLDVAKRRQSQLLTTRRFGVGRFPLF